MDARQPCTIWGTFARLPSWYVRASTGRRQGDWASFISSGREEYRSLAVLRKARNRKCCTAPVSPECVDDFLGEARGRKVKVFALQIRYRQELAANEVQVCGPRSPARSSKGVGGTDCGDRVVNQQRAAEHWPRPAVIVQRLSLVAAYV
jgi:hypothetical protein